LQPDTLIPDLSSSQGWNRYTYVKNNPILYNDPSGHDSILSQFLAGFTAEVVSSVLWFSPKVQQDLAPNEHESIAMLAGRVVGDIASTVVGVAGIGAGGGAIAGGTLCVGLSVGGCLPAGAPTAVAGGALMLEGTGMSVRGAIGLGSNLALLAKKHKIYKSDTEEGTYIGRTSQSLEERQAQHQGNGRNRILKEIDEAETLEEARFKEQQAINENGGIEKLTNKRNELNPGKFL
jgi:hypothetical protein